MRLFLPKCLGITLLLCLYSIFISAQTGPAGVNSGSVLWLDASDVTAGGTAPSIGSTVSTWLDKSGSAHNATSTGTNTAIYTSGGANGLPVIRFNRSSSTAGTGFTVSGLDIRAVTSPQVTIFAVYRQNSNDGNNQAVWGNDNGSLQRYFNSKWSTGPTDGSLSTGGTASVITGASTVGETRLVTGVYSGLVTAGVNTGASNGSAVYINGKKLSTFTDMTAASSGQSLFKIGSDGDDNYFNGDVSEIIVYNRKLTDCELETVSRYLADKYGIDFSNIGSYYSLGSPVNNDINGVGKPASACSGNPLVTSANSDIAIISNPSSVSAGAVLTVANDRGGYSPSSETPPAYTSRLTQKWRADLTGIVGTVDICFNLSGLGIDVSNSANFALLIDKDGNFGDATPVTSGVSVFVDRVCISGVSLTKGDYFTLATTAAAATASSVTSTNKGIIQRAAFTTATVIDNQILVKGSNSITNGRVYIDTGFVSGDVIAWGTLPTGVTAAYNAATGAAVFTGTATAAQWQAFYRTVTFRTTSGNVADRVIRFVLGNVITFSVGSKPHYYEAVTTAVNWTTAKSQAAAKTLYGLQGYLATVTSQAENDFIRAKLASTGWIGASCNYLQVNGATGATTYNNQTSADGHYYWITGPETGVHISDGLNNPVAYNGAYMYWNSGEPNNSNGTNEQYVQLNTLKWNDLPLSSTLGYVVEYGGYPTDSMMNIDYSRTVRNAPAGPVLVSITNDSGSSTTDKITNDSTLIIKGTSPNSAGITLFLADTLMIGSTTATTAGAWTFDYTSVILKDGTYNFTAIDTVGGIISAASSVFQVVVDRTAPAKPGTPALASGNGAVINTKTPVLTGSAEPASVVTIYIDGTSRGTATTDVTGKWTFTSPSITEATHSITVKATDVAGNISVFSDAFSLKIDVTAPATPPAPTLVGGTNGYSTSATPTIKGTAEASAMVLIIKDGVVIDSVAADATGNYTYTFATALSDGTYSITVKARDVAGNLSAASPALSLKIDTTAPVNPPAPTLVGGNNGAINNNKPTIKGTAEANTTIIIYNGGVAVDSVAVDATGNYTYTPTVAAPDGTYTVTVKDKDAAGNVSGFSPALVIKIDTGVPVTPTAPVLVGPSNTSTPTIKGVAEANSTVIIYKGGVAIDSVTADASGNYIYTFLVPLADGTYSISVKDKDAAGNVSAFSPVLTLKIDTTPPATPPAPTWLTGSADNTPDIKGTAEVNSTVIIYKDGVAIDSVTANATGIYTYTFTTALADGTYSITVKAKDAAGNVSAASPALSVIIDTTAPATPGAPVWLTGSGDNTPDIKGTAEANSTVTIYRDGVSVGTTTADATGNYTYTFVTPLTDGAHAITVTSKDAAGNTSGTSSPLNITIDTTSPATPAAPIWLTGSSDNTPDIKGTAEANSTVTIYRDGVSVGTTTVDATGNYTYTFTVPLTDGAHAITVTATDAAGNISATSPALNITIDTTSPATPAAPIWLTGSGDNTPDIKGTTEANATVTIYSDGVSVGTTTADATGNYTYTFTVPLTDGAHAITVTATDAAGNVSATSPALNITIDTAAPATPAAPIWLTGSNDNTPGIKGTAEANSTVIIYKGGVAIDSVTADATGKYTYTFATALADGTYSITVKAKDAAGNVSAASPALSITIDTTPPVTPAAPIWLTGSNDNTPDIKGTAEANSTVTIYSDGVSVGTTAADATGNYTYTFSSSLTDGAHAITVTATDAAGNISATSPALNITIDTTVPATPGAPVWLTGSGDNTPDIKGTTEANATVTIYRDGVSVGTTTTDATGNYTYTFTVPLTDGAHAITVTATDAAGNVSATSPALNITIDTTPPATPAAPIWLTGSNDNTPDIKGTAEANSTVIIYKGGVAIDSVTADATGKYTYTFATALADGTYSITVKAKDAAGNVSAASPALSITIDTTPPVTPAAPIWLTGSNDNTPDIKGTAEANSTVTIYSDGVSVGTTTADATGNYTYTFTVPLTDGAHAITVTATDAAGNVSATSPALNITIDTTVPATPAAPIWLTGNADNTPDIKGSAEANATVIIFQDGVAVDSVTADAIGNYTYTFATALADGTYSITVKAKDAAGNVSAASPALSITIDTTPPATPAAPIWLTPANDNTPDIKGTAEANSTVIIYKGGVAVDSVAADASGNYTYTFTTALADATYSITVKARDTAGNLSGFSPALSMTIDTNPPATPTAPILVGGTNVNEPTIKGKAEANSTVTVYADSVAVGTTTADASGNYTYTFTAPLSDSTHSITVTATDAAGNISGMSPALVVTIDTTVPVTPSAPIWLTPGKDNTPDIKGTAEANSTVTIYNDGVQVATVTADASGNYTYTFTTALPDGPHAITVTATDIAGNTSAASPALNVIIDTSAPATPAAPVLVGGNNGLISDASPDITGTAEANATVIIYKGGVAIDSVTADASGNYTYTFTPDLADGTYSITVKAKDAAGNVSAFSPALTIIVDTTPPATPPAPVLIGGTNGLINDNTPDIKGTAEAKSIVWIFADGVKVGMDTADASGNYAYTFTTTLADGPHAITVVAVDAAGNISPFSPALNIVVDTNGPGTPPAPILVSGSNNATTDPTPDIKGTAEAKDTITIYVDGVKAGTTIADASGNYTFTFLQNLLDGQHAITVTAKDAGGNVSNMSPALNIVIDAHAPGRPPAPVLVSGANNITNDATPDIKGKAEANSTVTIYIDGDIVGTVAADSTGNYTYTFTTALQDGSHAVTVTAKDALGNTSVASLPLNFSVDTHAPGTPTAPVLLSGSNNLTNDNTPDIKGKAEPNSTVTIYTDGVKAGTAPVDSTGNYTFTFPVAIPDGPHAVTAGATDAAGNASDSQSPALNIVIDTKPPATPYTPILQDGANGVTKTTNPTVIGVADPKTTITVYVEGVAVGTTTTDSLGNWSYTFNPGISNGVHTITVTASDPAGNVSPSSPALIFTVNAHIPDVPAPPRLPGVNGTTNNATPSIAGQGEPGTLITIYTDGVKTGTATVDANGNWTYKYNPALSETAHNITVSASLADGSNESGQSAVVVLTIDLVGPTVKLTSNASTDGSVPNTTLTVTVTFSEAVSGFSWDDVVVTNGKVSGFTQISSGIYQVLITPSTDGVVTVLIPDSAALDLIGNGNKASELLSINMKLPVGIVQVYPMPATSVINVRFDGVVDAKANVTMTNMAGQVLQNQPVTIINSVMSLNVSRLPAGTYVLRAVLNDVSYHITVVIAR